MEGTVKWFHNAKGYGFIGRDDGPDVFVHYTGIVGEGYKTLEEGNTVEFEIVQAPNRLRKNRAGQRFLDWFEPFGSFRASMECFFLLPSARKRRFTVVQRHYGPDS